MHCHRLNWSELDHESRLTWTERRGPAGGRGRNEGRRGGDGRWGMFAPGFVALGLALITLTFMKDSPEAAGYPPVGAAPAPKKTVAAAAPAGWPPPRPVSTVPSPCAKRPRANPLASACSKAKLVIGEAKLCCLDTPPPAARLALSLAVQEVGLRTCHKDNSLCHGQDKHVCGRHKPANLLMVKDVLDVKGRVGGCRRLSRGAGPEVGTSRVRGFVVGGGTGEPKKGVFQILTQDVLRNPYVWAFAISYFFVYVVRQGVTSWFVFYLKVAGLPPPPPLSHIPVWGCPSQHLCPFAEWADFLTQK